MTKVLIKMRTMNRCGSNRQDFYELTDLGKPTPLGNALDSTMVKSGASE
jgi:hypothetical protein